MPGTVNPSRTSGPRCRVGWMFLKSLSLSQPNGKNVTYANEALEIVRTYVCVNERSESMLAL